jgi:hypothetical protein
MPWTYRLVHHQIEVNGLLDEHYSIHEVYYDESGNPTSMTEGPVTFIGDTKEEVIEELIHATRDAQAYPVFVPPKEWKEK